MLLQLPNGWLWDMVDEFVYQFQSWQQYRGKLSTKGAEELESLRSCDQVWSILSVLNYLQALADKSGIAKELSTAGETACIPYLIHRGPCMKRRMGVDQEAPSENLGFILEIL